MSSTQTVCQDSIKDSDSYKLTQFPVGSILEMLAISFPLMLGLISTHLMMFVDRFFLAEHSFAALNAGANASLAYFIFLVIPIAICSISEVLVGRLHGDNRLKEVGKPVWQMIWFSIMLSPLFGAIAYFMPSLIFYGTGNETNETAYFSSLMVFAPFFCCIVAMNGLFIGIGKVKIVALCTVIANLFNMFLGYILILGYGIIPPLGALGAGLATGIAQIFQLLVLSYFFFQKNHKSTYGTDRWEFNLDFFREGLSIGFSAGLAHFFEVLAHYLFFRFLIIAGGNQFTIVVLVQSFSILFAFLIEAQSKGICAISANLIGAKKYHLITQVLKSGLKLHSLFFIALSVVIALNPATFLQMFLPSHDHGLMENSEFVQSVIEATLWMSLFFLFDGFSWIVIGVLIAAGDTKFLLYISFLIHWTVYIFAAYFLIGPENGAKIAWMIIALCSMLNFAIFLWRYLSKKWMPSQELVKC